MKGAANMFGHRRAYQIEEGIVKISFAEGEGWITPLTDEIINIFAPFETREHCSKAIEGNKAAGISFAVKEKPDYLEITTKRLTLQVYDDFLIDIYDETGRLLCRDYRGKRRLGRSIGQKFVELLEGEGHKVNPATDLNYEIQVLKQMEGDEAFYGLGDKVGCLNKRHYDYVMWNSDLPEAHTEAFQALYKSIPFFITLRRDCVYGIFFDNTYRSYVDFGKETNDYYYFGAEQGNLDYYFIAGETMPQIVKNYTYLTGRTPLPQLFTLGYHQSRWGYETTADVRGIAAKYRDLEIPIDTIHLDIDYMEHYKVFTWNEADFGEPGKVIRDLSKDGFKFITIIDPGVKVEDGYPVYEEGMRQGYFAKTPEGEVYVNAVWPGDAVFPDFGNPRVREWWADNQKYLVDLGARGVWNDMNEPASFRGQLPDDVVFTDEDRVSNHAKMHNVYGHLMAKAAYEGWKKYDGRRPFVLTRACYSGSQKYAAGWTGDNQSLWEHLRFAVPQLCSMGLSGMAFVGTDVGGFGADVTPELLARWVQVGCFSPFFRNHASKGSTNQEPWQFGEEVLAIYKKYVVLRYHFLPYFYDLFRECETTGLPPMRPLVLHYEKDENVKNLNGEFLMGERMLVAPVMEPGMNHKLVYLPKGVWYDYWTGEKLDGGKWLMREAPLDTCPVYVRGGSILPAYEPMQYVGERELDTLILEVYSGNGRYVHHQDNGEDFTYRKGAYNEYEMVILADGTLKIELTHQGYEKVYRKFIVRHNGKEQEFAFNGRALTIWL